MKKTKELLAEGVSGRRKALKLTQAKLAEAARLSINMVQSIEYQTVWPSAESIDKVAVALKAEPAVLFGGEVPAMTPTQSHMAKVISGQQAEINNLEKEIERLQAFVNQSNRIPPVIFNRLTNPEIDWDEMWPRIMDTPAPAKYKKKSKDR